MEYKTYKLGTCFSLIENGAIIKQRKEAKGFPITRIETLSHGKFNRDKLGHADIFDTTPYKRYILEDKDLIMSHINSRAFLGRTVLYRKKGNEQIIHGMNVLRIKTNELFLDPVFASYLFKTSHFKKAIDSIRKDAINQSSINIFDICNIQISLPSITEQRKISHALQLIDKKIETNHLINDNLEAMAKQLYDYWFVQFDFPNEEGKPYKSNGGVMVWNEDLHMSIPCTWNTCLLSDYIGSNNTGDWGFDEPAKKRSIKVGCIRGADIVKLNDLPIRYIKDNNTSKLLSAWDIVIEVSGGSPTQATGRSAFVTPGVLKRNGGNLTCSNFCHAFTMKDYKASAYFYFMWRMFYDNNNMFNFEGKTSGIKNFMTDTFLANRWLDVPTALLDLFFERVKVIYEQIDNNIEEINALTKQRDELLPLLMNGQATVNYHLSYD